MSYENTHRRPTASASKSDEEPTLPLFGPESSESASESSESASESSESASESSESASESAPQGQPDDSPSFMNLSPIEDALLREVFSGRFSL